MTIRRFQAARRAAGPLLVAMLSTCEAATVRAQDGPSLSLSSTPPPAVAPQELRPREEPAVPMFAMQTDARHAELEAATGRIDAVLQHGFGLAQRGALYSARAEFHKALWLLAQALDGPTDDRHSAALTAAILALEEAEDFVPPGAHPEAEIDVGLRISGHRTPVLKTNSPEIVTPRMALNRYLVFAQQKLADAADGQAAGSKALYLLGRLHTVAAQDRSPRFVAAEQKALAFQQAAMATDPNNVMAANELGVLLARAGRYEEARTILQHCVGLSPRAEVWHNLVAVHRNLGEIGLAQQAQEQLEAAQARQPSPAPIGKPSPAEMVQWVEPEQFAQPTFSVAPAAAHPAGETTAPAAAPDDHREPAGPFGWFPWSRQTK